MSQTDEKQHEIDAGGSTPPQEGVDVNTEPSAAEGTPPPSEGRDREETEVTETPEETEGEAGEPESAATETEDSPDGETDSPETAEELEPSEPTADSDDDDDFEWYVLRVQSGREDTVSNALRKKLALTQMDHLVKEIAVPKQKMTEIKEGKKKIRETKMFPGYIFLHMNLEDDLWYLIRDTSGIGDFVGSHSKPIPMPPSEVQKIVSMMEEKEEAPEVKIDLVKNDPVKIKEGPFENFDGVVEEVHPSKGMVRVMVTIFGRATPVDLEYWQVEKL